MELIQGQLWNLVVMLLLLSIVFVGLTKMVGQMVGQGKWGWNKVCKAWKWLFLAPFRAIRWLGKGLWKMLFPKKKKSAGRSGRRGGTRSATTT